MDTITIRLKATFEGIAVEFDRSPAKDDPLAQNFTRGLYFTLAEAAQQLPLLPAMEAERRGLKMDR